MNTASFTGWWRWTGPRTLRGRLIMAMVAILVLALGVSSLVDTLGGAAPIGPDGSADGEPYQDALVLAGFSLPALALIWLVSSWSLRPLARISQEARNVGPANPAARLSPAGLPAEILPLVDAVNGALDRMAGAVASERRFTENAAHELRTPLAVLSLRLQRARQGVADGQATPDWAAIDADLAQMNRLVSQMLDLARKENAGRDLARPVINLCRIAREASAMVLPLAEAHGRTVSLTAPETLNMPGHAEDVRDSVVNLLENAILHGQGAIRLACHRDGADAVLRVSDEGPGIPPSQTRTIFERFQKGAASQGTGLGLAIVNEVTRGHGGTVAVLPAPGCHIEVKFPAG